MIDKLDEHFLYIKNFKSQKIDDIESLKIQYLGRKGIINDLFSNFKNVPTDQKKNYGQKINDLKVLVQNKYDELISRTSKTQKKNYEDYSKPGFPIQIGSLHPITIVKNRIIDVFSKLGFGLSESPEIEDDWHNFTALNLPEDHPARDMQDTFFIQRDPDLLLRTHCSTIQIRHLEENPPPAKVIQAGRVYRNEAISSRSHCIFHQVDGIYVDENVSFADLKQMVLYFAKSIFGKSKLRFRPSYFPFTEPSAEVDILSEDGKWLEILGCGIINPVVLDNCKIDSTKYSGLAFGLGVERIAMLKHGIQDIREIYKSNLDFLTQFK